MGRTIEMQDLRYLNLFEKVTHIKTRFILKYNNTVIFCVPRPMLSKALGHNGENLRRIGIVIKKRVRIIPTPMGPHHAKDFLLAVVKPAAFKDVEVTEGEIIITAGGTQTRATLFGRNKVRFIELQKVVNDFFNKELKIV
jgi:hypothetical protein